MSGGGRAQRKSDHGGPWIVRLRGECCFVREQHMGGGFGLLWSNREIRKLAGGDLFSRGRSSSTSTQREEEERRGKQGAGHEHPGPSRPNVSLSLSPLVHNVDVELGPTQRGPDTHGSTRTRHDFRPTCMRRARHAVKASRLTTAFLHRHPTLLTSPVASLFAF
jgi:hypothetical protein